MSAEHLAAEARSPDICSIQREDVEIARLVIRRRHTRRPSSAKLKTPLARKTKQKNSTEDKSHSENDKFPEPRAERLSLGGNKGSAVYSTPTVIELTVITKGRQFGTTAGLHFFGAAGTTAKRRKKWTIWYTLDFAARRRLRLGQADAVELRLEFTPIIAPNVWPQGRLAWDSQWVHMAHYSSRAIIYRMPVININWEASGTAHGISSSAPISPHRVLIYQLESQSGVFYHRTTLGSQERKKLETYLNEKADNGKQRHEAVASVHDEAIV
ncbi:hypothetical protein EDB89DRAFT_2242517 [Lactarius sanguifluus]|nr:hypothetical protein EDB89DRAFT_2242517 [Lactarius sanguifluus]